MISFNRDCVERRSFLLRAAAAVAMLRPEAVSAASRAPAPILGEPIERVESAYNNIFIYRMGPYVGMTFGRNPRLFTESLFDTRDDRLLPVPYTRSMTAVLCYGPQEPKSILQIGLGGGRTAWYCHRHLPDTVVIAIEIDPAVVGLAAKHFGVQPNEKFRIVVGDGRLHLMRNASSRFDYIMIDAYRDRFVPFHLLTRQFYELVSQRLTPGGAVAQNVAPSTMLFDAAVATMRSVFRHVDFFPAEGNVVLVAHNGEKPVAQDTLMKQAEAVQARYGFRHDLRDIVRTRRDLGEPVQAAVMTDDFAPVEALHGVERHNRKWE